MRAILLQLLILLGKLLLLPLRILWGLAGVIAWLSVAITGELRWIQQQRTMMTERPPLPDPAFVEQTGIQPNDVAVALATREAVARACGLPATALSPGDPLSTLRALMAPGPDAHWADLGADWCDVVFDVGELLGLAIFGGALDELDERWRQAERKGQLKNLGQLVRLLADFVREAGPPRPAAGRT